MGLRTHRKNLKGLHTIYLFYRVQFKNTLYSTFSSKREPEAQGPNRNLEGLPEAQGPHKIPQGYIKVQSGDLLLLLAFLLLNYVYSAKNFFQRRKPMAQGPLRNLKGLFTYKNQFQLLLYRLIFKCLIFYFQITRTRGSRPTQKPQGFTRGSRPT